jgi:RHS repeat-associated protein
MRTAVRLSSKRYSYAGMAYANPHAVTQIATGVSTSTFVYDNNGNLVQKTTNGTSTTYVWDYANRLTALGVGGQGTTTFGYDAFGARVYQIASTTATTTYPFKFFSVSSSTRSGTNYSTTTEYVFNGDTLLATVDQAFRNGAATGTSQTRYIHPDHLGSTNVVTNASGTVVQTLDYFPFGGLRISGGTNVSDRKYIGQFADQSNLDYLNARYYSPTQGQFISQDPVFWEVGLTQDGKLALINPQALNSYGYANDNPITSKDPNGRCPTCLAGAIAGAALGVGSQAVGDYLAGNSFNWQSYVGAAAGGAVQGAFIGSGAGVATLLFSGALSGATQGGIREGLQWATGDQGGFQASAVGADTLVGGFSNVVGGKLVSAIGIPKIAGLTKGRNSYDAIFQSLLTKLQNGSIKNISAKSQGKIGVSYGFNGAYSAGIQGVVQAVQSYNKSSGASTPESKLWVTPSGAVVSWSGSVISSPQSSK